MRQKTHPRPWLTVLGVVLLLVAGALVGPAAAAERGQTKAKEKQAPCCFTNQRYSGVCEVVPEGDETCSSILAYLNNPMSTGKLYCGATDIRGEWKLVSCDDSKRDSGKKPKK